MSFLFLNCTSKTFLLILDTAVFLMLIQLFDSFDGSMPPGFILFYNLLLLVKDFISICCPLLNFV